MRILYSHRVQSHDGQSVHIEELVTALREAGNEVVVAGPSFYEKADFGGESRLIAAIRKGLPGALGELAELLYNLVTFLRLRSACRRLAPDFLYERYNLYHLAGMLLKQWYRVPFYLEVNSPLAEERARFGGLALQRLARKLERLVWRSADRIFVVNAVLAEMVAAAGVSIERIRVVPNGVSRNAFPPNPYQARSGNSVNIGFVGFVREWHGLHEVIAGLANENAIPPIRLTIGGPSHLDLQTQAQALGVGNLVQFTGLLQRRAVPA